MKHQVIHHQNITEKRAHLTIGHVHGISIKCSRGLIPECTGSQIPAVLSLHAELGLYVLSSSSNTGYEICLSCLISYIDLSVTVLFCSVLSGPVLSCPVLSCPVLSCHALFCPVMPYSVLSCPVLSCRTLSCHALFCLVLSCPILSCHA